MKNQEKIAQLDVEKRALMCCKLRDLHIDQKTRSKTFPGIADAMAEQWGIF